MQTFKGTINQVMPDLIFANVTDNYSKPQISAPLGTSDHSCLKLHERLKSAQLKNLI